MEKRIIFHIDVNNAFLSWTAILLLQEGYKIDIRNIPAVIGGDEKRRSGIVLAKSMVAKKYGIVTAETLYSARNKCKNLKVYPPNYYWYYEKSHEFHEYLKQFTPNTLKYSVDEAFLDFTGTKYIYSDYIKLAHHIKDEIKEKFGFTVNVGIANNMLCAKMASDFQKPDRVHTLFDEEVKEKMWPLPIEDLFMVGKSTSKRLRELGINTIGDLANKDLNFLTKYFKNQAEFLKNSANGIDESKVEPHKSKSESISVTETMPKDLQDINELKEILFRQTSEVSRQLRDKNKFCNVVAVIFKNQAEFLKNSANGINDTKVEPHKSKSESISVTETMPKDLQDINELKEILFRQTSEVSRQLRDKNKYCNVVAVIFKNHQFESYSRQTKLDNPTDNTEIIYDKVVEILENSWKNDPIRLIGVRLADLCSDRKTQISLFDNNTVEEDDKNSSFQKKIDEINKKFGSNSVVPASIVNKIGKNKLRK